MSRGRVDLSCEYNPLRFAMPRTSRPVRHAAVKKTSSVGDSHSSLSRALPQNATARAFAPSQERPCEYFSTKQSRSFSTIDSATRTTDSSPAQLQEENRRLRREIDFYSSLLDQKILAHLSTLEKEVATLDKQLLVFGGSLRSRCWEHYRAGQRRHQEGMKRLEVHLASRFAIDDDLVEGELRKLTNKLQREVDELSANPRTFLQRETQRELAELENELQVYQIIRSL